MQLKDPLIPNLNQSIASSRSFTGGSHLQTIKILLHQILPLCDQCGFKQYICVQSYCKLPKEPICYACHNSYGSQHFLHRKNEISLLFLDRPLYATYSQFMKNKKNSLLQYLHLKLNDYNEILKMVQDYIKNISILIEEINKIDIETQHSMALKQINEILKKKIERKSKMCNNNQKTKILENLKKLTFSQFNKFHQNSLSKFQNLYANTKVLDITLNYRYQNFHKIQQRVYTDYENGLNNTIQMIMLENHLDRYIPTSKIYSYQNRSITNTNSQDVNCSRMNAMTVKNNYVFSNLLEQIQAIFYQPMFPPLMNNLKSLKLTFNESSSGVRFTFDHKFASLVKLHVTNAFDTFTTDITYNLRELKNLMFLNIYDLRINAIIKKSMLRDVLVNKKIRICKIQIRQNLPNQRNANFNNANNVFNFNVQNQNIFGGINFNNINNPNFIIQNNVVNLNNKINTEKQVMKNILTIHQIHRTKLNNTYMKIKQQILEMLINSKTI